MKTTLLLLFLCQSSIYYIQPQYTDPHCSSFYSLSVIDSEGTVKVYRINIYQLLNDLVDGRNQNISYIDYIYSKKIILYGSYENILSSLSPGSLVPMAINDGTMVGELTFINKDRIISFATYDDYRSYHIITDLEDYSPSRMMFISDIKNDIDCMKVNTMYQSNVNDSFLIGLLDSIWIDASNSIFTHHHAPILIRGIYKLKNRRSAPELLFNFGANKIIEDGARFLWKRNAPYSNALELLKILDPNYMIYKKIQTCGVDEKKNILSGLVHLVNNHEEGDDIEWAITCIKAIITNTDYQNYCRNYKRTISRIYDRTIYFEIIKYEPFINPDAPPIMP